LVYVDEQNEVAICHKAHQPQAAVDAETLGRLCKQIYALPAAGPRLQLRADIKSYLDAMSATAQRAWQRAMLACNVDEALSLLEHDTPHFCHNDLTAGNLMSDDRQLMAIDWEYAALGSRYFDIAIAAGSLESRERERLVDVVFGDTVDDALVRAGHRIASLVTALWQTQYTPLEAPEPGAWASRREARA
jgi:thiamine kinase-like enzyme